MTMLGTELLATGSLPMPLHIYVVCNTPGRLRFRVAQEHRQPETLGEIAGNRRHIGILCPRLQGAQKRGGGQRPEQWPEMFACVHCESPSSWTAWART